MLKSIAEESREEQERKQIHKILTKYYIKILKEILKENSVSKESKDNEIIMNNLWFFEMNIWDWVYRSLEIKKNRSLNKKGTFGSDSHSPSPNKSKVEDLNNDIARIDSDLFSLGARTISNDIFLSQFTDYDPNNDLFAVMGKNRKNEEDEENQQNILGELVNKVKDQIMPLPSKTVEIEDKNVLSFIQKVVLPGGASNKGGMLIKPKPKIKKKIEASNGESTSFMIREMDRRLK